MQPIGQTHPLVPSFSLQKQEGCRDKPWAGSPGEWQRVAYIRLLPSVLLGPSPALITDACAQQSLCQPWTVDPGRQNTQSEGCPLSARPEATGEALGYALVVCRARKHL